LLLYGLLKLLFLSRLEAFRLQSETGSEQQAIAAVDCAVIKSFTIADLKAKLSAVGQPTSGSKQLLFDR
jgi:hypothetical protein